MTNIIRVLIADDNLIDREGIHRILERETDLTVIGEARTPPEAVSLAHQKQPDVLILDLRWAPDYSVLSSLIKQLGNDCPNMAILGLTAYPEFMETAHQAGLKWVLGKEINKDDLIFALRSVNLEKKSWSFQELQDINEAMVRIKRRAIGSEFSDHETDVVLILESLFKPFLSNPRTQASTRDRVQRRDVIFSNNSDSGFWSWMRTQYGANQIVFEVKNVSKIDENHFRQIAAYLTPAIGRLGFLVSRKPITKTNMAHAISIFHNDNKVILSICDNDLENMLQLKENGQDPTQLIKQYFDKFSTEP
jgi:DNA-binding NarL/FixJ family response regulator